MTRFSKLGRIVVVTVAGVLGVVASAAQEVEPLSIEQQRAVLAEAQQAYDEAVATLRRDPAEARRHFEQAAERFRLLVDSGVENGRLLYNLGNAQLQAGRLAPAILSYRRAERLIPGDPRLHRNLEYARSQVERRIEPVGGRALTQALLAWHHRTPTRTRLIVFAIAYVLLWPSVLLAVWRVPSSGVWSGLAIAAAALAIATGISVAADLNAGDRGAVGVVLQDGVVVRKGNGEGYEPRFEEPLSRGVEFQVLERRGSWLHVELRDGNTGWIRASSADLVGA